MTNWIKNLFRRNIHIRAWVVVLGLAIVPYTVHAIAVSALTALTGANSATGDLFVVVDISEALAADRTKNITRDELAVGLALATSDLVVVAEIDTSSELLTIVGDETGTGVLVFGTSPTFTTGITVPANSISDNELDEGAAFDWTGAHDFASTFTSRGIDDNADANAVTISVAEDIIVGTTAILNGTVQEFQVSTVTSNGGIGIFMNDTVNTNSGRLLITKSANASRGSLATAVVDNEELGDITWAGSDGTDFNQAASIAAEIDGTPSDGTDMPGALVFSTTAEASGTPTEALRISSAQVLILANDLAVTEGGTGASTLNDLITLTTHTTGNYAAGDAEAGAATTGDSATSFFSSGTIEHERGGLEADVSAFGAGLYGQTSGFATIDIDTEAELETAAVAGANILLETEIDASSELAAIMDDETGTGLLVFATEPVFTTTIQLPASDAPTVDADGEIALDTLITGHTDLLIYRGGDAAEDKLVIAVPRDQLTTIDGHVIAYNAIDDEFEMVAVAAGSGDITDVFSCVSGDCASITMAATDLLDMSGTDASTTTEGLILPQHATACAGGTAEGQVCWEADSNRLFVGDASALQLIGRITSISNAAISAATNLDVTGFASAIYDNYEIWISNGQPGTDNVILEMETSTDGGTSFDTGVSDYSWAVGRNQVDAQGVNSGDDADSEIQITGIVTVGNAANENVSVKVSTFRPEAAEFTSFVWDSVTRGTTTVSIHHNGGADRRSAADVDALRFHWAAGDWVAQGFIQFLGIAQ